MTSLCYLLSCWRKTTEGPPLRPASSPFSTTRASLMSPPHRFRHCTSPVGLGPSHPIPFHASAHDGSGNETTHQFVMVPLAVLQVLGRVLAGMVPFRTSLVEALHPNPDLYGPFWLCATLIFCTAVSGNIARIFRLLYMYVFTCTCIHAMNTLQ